MLLRMIRKKPKKLLQVQSAYSKCVVEAPFRNDKKSLVHQNDKLCTKISQLCPTEILAPKLPSPSFLPLR